MRRSRIAHASASERNPAPALATLSRVSSKSRVGRRTSVYADVVGSATPRFLNRSVNEGALEKGGRVPGGPVHIPGGACSTDYIRQRRTALLEWSRTCHCDHKQFAATKWGIHMPRPRPRARPIVPYAGGLRTHYRWRDRACGCNGVANDHPQKARNIG